MTSARIRPIEDPDYQSLASTLNSAFSTYRDATLYTNPMLAYFKEWMWSDSPSLVLSDGEVLHGALMAGFRTVRAADENLRVLHIGPFGIEKPLRRLGWGTKMLRALTQEARESGADMLTLTTEALYGAHRLYRREGFDPIQAFRPRLLMLSTPQADPAPFEGIHTSSNICPRGLTSLEAPASDLIESGPAGPPIPAALHPNQWELSGGRATTIQWSILTRQGDRETRQRVAQLIAWEPGETPDALFRAVREHSAAQGSACLYALSGLSGKLPQLQSKGSALVYRMGRPLTEKGKNAMREARYYTEIAPAP